MRGRAFRRTAFGLLVLVPLFTMLMPGGDVVPAQAARAKAKISYSAWAGPSFWDDICVGQLLPLPVSILRFTTVNGRVYEQFVAGGRILGHIDDDRVGQFEPPGDAGRDVGADPQSEAEFFFRAKSPGRTTIEFRIISTGEESRVGGGHAQAVGKVDVEVINCFEAYTSGLATVFDTDSKFMGALDEFFLLAGRIAGSTVAGTTQYMVFIPNPQNPTTGNYALVDTYWPLVASQDRCTAYITGRYDVVFYPDEEHVVEGDLLMTGTGVAVCPGNVIPIDYTTTGFQIGFKPIAAGP